MLLKTQQESIRSSDVLDSTKFTVHSSPKLLQLLVKDLYSNPIRAFIRELSTNAYESHQMAGCEDRPFDVTLPKHLNLTWSIRDYGVGLTPTKVKELYTVLLASDKETTNEYGGCFGLGAKSPLAYTSNFTMTSFVDGKRYIYNIYIDEKGYPCCDLLLQEDTDEPNGVLVSVPVKSHDVTNIINETNDILKYFITPPNIDGTQLKTDFYYDGKYLRILNRENSYYYRSTESVQMGNIVYPSLKDGFSSAILKLNIGDVNIEPSRESLIFDDKTKAAILNVRKLAAEELKEFIDQKLNEFTSEFQKTKFKYSLPYFVKTILKIETTYFDVSDCAKCFDNFRYSRSYPEISHDTRLFVADTDTYVERLGKYYREQNIKKAVVCNINRGDDLEKLKTKLGAIDSDFTYVSSLPEVEKTKVKTKTTKSIIVPAYLYQYSTNYKYKKVSIKPDEEICYLPLRENQVVFGTNLFSIENFYTNPIFSKIIETEGKKLYLVSESNVKKLTKATNVEDWFLKCQSKFKITTGYKNNYVDLVIGEPIMFLAESCFNKTKNIIPNIENIVDEINKIKDKYPLLDFLTYPDAALVQDYIKGLDLLRKEEQNVSTICN